MPFQLCLSHKRQFYQDITYFVSLLSKYQAAALYSFSSRQMTLPRGTLLMWWLLEKPLIRVSNTIERGTTSKTHLVSSKFQSATAPAERHVTPKLLLTKKIIPREEYRTIWDHFGPERPLAFHPLINRRNLSTSRGRAPSTAPSLHKIRHSIKCTWNMYDH